MMKYALLLTARDKVRYVSDAVRSMFAQVGPSIELLLSDQGSKDGTREVLDDLARSYAGPHKVRRLNCPHTDLRGMPGLNTHINWAVTQTEADVVMQISADDYDLAQRSELTIAAFEEFKPSMVLGAQYFVDPAMKYLGETPHPKEDGWCTVEEMYAQFVGGSTCQAWHRDFYDKIGGLSGVGSPDIVLPFLACLDKGAYFLATKVHAYRKVDNLQNTGLEGIYNALPTDDPQRRQLEELMHFQVLAGHYAVLTKMDAAGLRTDAAVNALASAILDRSASWCNVRQAMTFDRIPPAPFKL